MTAMKRNLTQKILSDHLVEGELSPGAEIGLRIDHTLLQDATGTLAMLEFEALGLAAVKAELAAQYVDHNILHTDFKNADDHKFLQTACARYGIHFSGAGNGVSHQVHMERFGIPGKTLLGADSHTTGAAGVSMLGIGAGGLDVALAMAGFPYYLPCPRVLGVKLLGRLPDWVSAKDVILEMLRRFSVKGCVGKIVEYYGPGVATLSATDRETIGNMGAELGATSSIFPSDERTREYLEAQGRGQAWRELSADEGAPYDEDLTLDLGEIEPLIAKPTSPGNVVPVREVAGTKVDQVIVGSSVNSSFRDLMVSAKILEGRHVHPTISFHVNPGSRQVLENIARENGMLAFLGAGARVHEPGCLGCIGMGQAPGTGEISLRTFPRNFPGRSGTKDDQVYLCSPETATASALRGVITDPRDLAGEHDIPAHPGPGAVSHGRPLHRLPLRGAEEHRRRARSEHQTPARARAASRHTRSRGGAAGGGQHLHRCDHAGGKPGAPAPFEHRGHQRACLRADPSRFCRCLPGAGYRRGRGRSELRPGVEPRACGARAPVPGRVRQDREEFRPHPQVQSLQLRRPAAYVQGPRRLRPAEGRNEDSCSLMCENESSGATGRSRSKPGGGPS